MILKCTHVCYLVHMHTCMFYVLSGAFRAAAMSAVVAAATRSQELGKAPSSGPK
jgi:hypothetical protein